MAHVQEQEATGSEVRLKLAEELVGGTEKEVSLQFAEYGLVAVAVEDLPLCSLAACLGGHLVEVAFAADDGAAHLVADKEQDRHCHADTGSGDQVNGQGDQDHAGDDAEIEPPGRIAQQSEHALIEHAPG